MLRYETLSESLCNQIDQEKATGTFTKIGFDDRQVIRRKTIPTDRSTVWRPAFVHDIDKILHCPYYNRYSDKTQVFSLVRNDDITRRSLHVQLVSRIARTIGSALNLNLDLIEAIALGHDLGHPPFAHKGESYLDELYHRHAGRHFSHHVHSVRVLDRIFPLNVSLQTLDGILGHNGEIECEEIRPVPLTDFGVFDEIVEKCYEDKHYSNKLMPSTLEGAVVRISDIIAYTGKDRQDAARIQVVPEDAFDNTLIGSINAEIINNLVVNIIENSYGKPYIRLDASHFQALKTCKQENYRIIYRNEPERAKLDVTVRPMMGELYEQLLEDLIHDRKHSPIFTHHIDYVNKIHYQRSVPYESADPHQLVVDYIASMTDDYFIALHRHLFPNSHYEVNYKGYFD